MLGFIKGWLKLGLLVTHMADGQGNWKLGTSMDANPHTGFIWGE